MLDFDMTEQSHDNLPAGDDKGTEQLDDEFIPDDARPLCAKCLEPCHPLQFYCDKCDSNEVINPLASYMPYVRIRFNVGMVVKAWRKMLYDEEASVAFRLSFLLIIIGWALMMWYSGAA
jgi:hypothetical protein